ncbi:hypothetical protein SUGI_0087610 [Cryptomeria japonica]|uniref:glucan endo-1,3-beta-glucosidase 5 n=1 Tax=Cryptomeria japonica TaxID=3369 RepID=UPI002408C2D9|nr:glucan endo-1,3-beta-glucosidase 5 [Cryptomeria japonica]GLJ08377.1 hypothetical protein SUGI_0087610 [Cryptomeria japonica]
MNCNEFGYLQSTQKMVKLVYSARTLAVLAWIMWICSSVQAVDIGVNWGTISAHRLPPPIVVRLLRANNIMKVKLFDADPLVLEALVGSGIQVMVGIPNDMLRIMSVSSAAADMWVHDNVTRYAFRGGVDIRYVAVGNEPFLSSYQGQFQSFVVPAVINVQQALTKANLAGLVKVVVPCNADAYQSDLPSQGTFRPDVSPTMVQLVSFLSKNGSPFVVNIYPFLSLYGNAEFPADYAFFDNSTHPVVDGQNVYTNAFDGNFDTLVAALDRIGFGQIPIIVGEIGWPSDGTIVANISNAKRFNQGLVDHVLSNKGTPLRPGVPPIEVYLFGLLDEGQKSVMPGNFERHWGIYTFDGQAKYHLELGQGSKGLVNAANVPYLPSRWCVANANRDLSSASNYVQLACSSVDCTRLLYGGSCNAIGEIGNVSYAFNSYYQQQNQAEKSCYFNGLGMITFVDPSIGDCRFLIGIRDSSATALYSSSRFFLAVEWMILMCLLTCTCL